MVINIETLKAGDGAITKTMQIGRQRLVKKCRQLLKRLNHARVGQIILSGNLPILRRRIDVIRNDMKEKIAKIKEAHDWRTWRLKTRCAESADPK